MNSEFVPNMTSSPTKSLLVLYGENNLDMSSSKVILNATPTIETVEDDGGKWKHVEKCRGIRGNNAATKRAVNQSNELRVVDTSDFSDLKATTEFTSILDIDHYYNYQRCLPIHDYEEVDDEVELEQFSFVNATCTAAKNKKFLKSNKIQRMHFEAGLKNRLMNNYNKKSLKKQKINVESNQKRAQSFISSISTSINSNEQKTFLSKSQSLSFKNNNCSCCRLKQVSFHTTIPSSNTSSLSITSAPLTACTYLTFDVKMASTPILNKRKNFNFDCIDNAKMDMKKKQMSTPLTNGVKRRFSSTKQSKADVQVEKWHCYPASVNEFNHQNHYPRKISSVSILKRSKYSLSKKVANTESLKVYKNVDMVAENVISNEIFECNGYLTNFIKKSSSAREKRIQMKKRLQKMNNISTSTKKESTILSADKKVSRKQQKNFYEYENVRKIEDYKKKTKTDFVKRIKLESAAAVAALATATHLPIHNISENVLSFNNYFPSSCLNKFNQLGQLQVWFV